MSKRQAAQRCGDAVERAYLDWYTTHQNTTTDAAWRAAVEWATKTVNETKHLCVCGAAWASPAHTRCEACGRPRHDYSVGLHQAYVDIAARIRSGD